MATTRRELETAPQAERKRQAGGARQPARRSGAQLQKQASRSASSESGESAAKQQSGLMNLSTEQLAKGLGWFSLGLGLAEVLAPRAIAKIAGVKGNTALIRLFGLREIASGLAIFAQGERPAAAALWSRVAGDALDLAALTEAFAAPDSHKGRVAFATANVLAVTALDVLCAQ